MSHCAELGPRAPLRALPRWLLVLEAAVGLVPASLFVLFVAPLLLSFTLASWPLAIAHREWSAFGWFSLLTLFLLGGGFGLLGAWSLLLSHWGLRVRWSPRVSVLGVAVGVIVYFLLVIGPLRHMFGPPAWWVLGAAAFVGVHLATPVLYPWLRNRHAS